MNPLAMIKERNFKKRLMISKNLKNRILKNKEPLLNAMGEKLEGNKCCPRLMGEPCIGEFCMFFMKFKTVDTETKQEKEYWNCVDVQTPLLLIEVNRNIKTLTEEIRNEKTS